MALACISFSHNNVPIMVREQLYFDSDATTNACARFRCGEGRLDSIQELVVLSTCNRVELYAEVCDSQCHDTTVIELCKFVSESCGVSQSKLHEMVKDFESVDAVRHLFRVASGLESLVIGEPQILGQVGDALKTALVMNSCGVVLQKLFQAAIKVGRRARNETQINQNSLNISTVAVNTAERLLGEIKGKTIVILGAGEMAELAMTQLRKRGAKRLLVVNRTMENAKQLAMAFDAEPFVFEQLHRVLGQADVLISSTGAPIQLVTEKLVRTAMATRPSQKMSILDIAVPRDVEKSVGQIPNVDLCDIDDLYVATGHSNSLRMNEITKVETIIEADLPAFVDWHRSVGVEPTISSLYRKVEAIRSFESTRLNALIQGLSPEDVRPFIDRFSKSLIRKLFHDVVTQLRSQHDTRESVHHAEALRELFKLDPENANSDAIVNTYDPSRRRHDLNHNSSSIQKVSSHTE